MTSGYPAKSSIIFYVRCNLGTPKSTWTRATSTRIVFRTPLFLVFSRLRFLNCNVTCAVWPAYSPQRIRTYKPLSLQSYYSNLHPPKWYSTCGNESLLRDPFLLQFNLSKEMSELISTEHGSEELIAPDAGTQEHAEDPTPASTLWGTGNTPSLPSIDIQHNTVSFRAVWVASILTQILDL